MFFSVTNRRNVKNTNIQVDDHLYASRHHNKAVYNIPNIQVCGLMGLFGLVLCLIVNNYHTQTPAIRMKYHPRDIYFCCLRTYYFSNFNLYAFRGTDALQPNSQMVHKHLARVRLTKWVLEIQEIRLINDVIVVFFVAMLKEFLSQETA